MSPVNKSYSSKTTTSDNILINRKVSAFHNIISYRELPACEQKVPDYKAVG